MVVVGVEEDTRQEGEEEDTRQEGVEEAEGWSGKPVSCSRVEVEAGAGQEVGVKGRPEQLGQLSYQRRQRHMPQQPPWPQQLGTVSD